MLNCMRGLLRRIKKINNKIQSPNQYVAGKNRNIQHGIARAYDAIYAANQSMLECGIGDQDYIAALKFLVLMWVWKVLRAKELTQCSRGCLDCIKVASQSQLSI